MLTRVLRLAPALALSAVAAMPAVTGTATAATTPAVHSGLTAQLRAQLDAKRRAYGLDPLFTRGYYTSHATAMATSHVLGQQPAAPSDAAPATWSGGTVVTTGLDLAAGAAIDNVVEALDAVLRFPLHTDIGAAVVVQEIVPGVSSFAVAGILGWPDRPTRTPTGCSTAGFCWSSGGLNPHLPWTRNQVRIHLSTANLPADGEYLLKAGLARVNSVAGLGADLVYAGRTAATTTSASHRFLVRWGSTGCSSGALACTSVDSQGSYDFVLGARIMVMTGQYRTGGHSREYWIGTFAHEIAHAIGLGHYDRLYAGSYQLMRWASGPNSPRSGDVNGLRTLDPAGRLTAKLTLPSRVRAGQTVTALVRAASTGLGGVRGVAVQCYDGSGSLRTFASRSGRWDIRASNYGVSWTQPGGRAFASRCRAMVSSKATRTYSAWVPVTLGG